ncbi:hypothetical protein D3C76_1203340 [compost metagenome]
MRSAHTRLNTSNLAASVEGATWPPGTHLVSDRAGFLHHGIYAGNGLVIHYAGLCETFQYGPVEEYPSVASRRVTLSGALNSLTPTIAGNKCFVERELD